ncbi:MAG: hypothetical protein WC972_05045 [Trueperaceae bacterium]
MSSYRNHYSPGGPDGYGVCVHDWEEFTAARLAWQYGAERAYAIISGQDAKTNADLAAWRSLGERRAA